MKTRWLAARFSRPEIKPAITRFESYYHLETADLLDIRLVRVGFKFLLWGGVMQDQTERWKKL
jgi:hypothetical protein